ncbi:MAG: hypothetical protein E7649_07430 [Ruminococcaceae bacterium]|nr:hypothetical protein [Oscillospiraceae bacterium]
MKVKYIGENDPLELLNGKIYDVMEVDEESGWYRIIDETGEDFLFQPDDFEPQNDVVNDPSKKSI